MIAAKDPTAQFELHKYAELKIGNFDLSFTNSALMMVVTLVCVALWFLLSSKRALIPGRAQSILEISYEFIADMLKSSTGKEGMRFFPLVFTIFVFILFANMLGMIPFFFTTTSHIIVTFALAMIVMCVVIGFGIWKNGFGFLKLFWPDGIPMAIKPFVSLLELCRLCCLNVCGRWTCRRRFSCPLYIDAGPYSSRISRCLCSGLRFRPFDECLSL